jgi:hypothetical protein
VNKALVALSFCLLVIAFLAPAASSAAEHGGPQIMVRMIDTVDSRSHRGGQKFVATLEEDLKANGRVLAPRGSRVMGRLIVAENPRRVFADGQLKLDFNNIMVDGHPMAITGGGARVVQAPETMKAGYGPQIMTHGQQIHVPGGTVLSYHLDEAPAH